MAGTFYFRKNSTTYKLYSVSNVDFASSGTVENFTACSNFFCFYQNTGSSSSAKCYVPALTTQGTKVDAGLDSNGLQVYYDTSSPTIAFRKNGKTYYCAKSVTRESYGIPSGTYVGQGAYNLFKGFISNNGYRTLKNSVTIRHMNITRTFNANTRVWLIYGYGGDIINLIFQTGGSPASGVDVGFGSYNSWWSSSSTNPGIQLMIYNGNPGWSTNNFTIEGGIKFN